MPYFCKVIGLRLGVGLGLNRVSISGQPLKAKRDTWSVSGKCYQGFVIVGVCYGGKAVVGSVGNMLTNSVTRLPVLCWLLMEGMNQARSVVVEMEALCEPGPRSRFKERNVF